MTVKLPSSVENISTTKLQILRSCMKEKTWTEIINETELSKPTIKSHIDRLTEESLLKKTDRGYQTTDLGIEQLNLKPHRRSYAPAEKISSETYRMINDAIFPGLTIKEKMLGPFAAGILRNVGGIRKVRLFLDDLSKAMRDSVVIWLPQELNLDKSVYKIVNRLISEQINISISDKDKGKFKIIIDFDLPLALDNVILDEKDSEIQKKLIENREIILKTLYKNWNKISK